MIIERRLKGGYLWSFDDSGELSINYIKPLTKTQIYSLECFLVRVNRKLSSHRRIKK